MGLFSILKETMNHSRGEILLSHWQDTKQKLYAMDSTIRGRALMGFLDKRNRLHSQIPNMTIEGCISMAKFLQKEARKIGDLNVAEGYALWMAGAWIEGMASPSDGARRVYQELEDLANHLESEI